MNCGRAFVGPAAFVLSASIAASDIFLSLRLLPHGMRLYIIWTDMNRVSVAILCIILLSFPLSAGPRSAGGVVIDRSTGKPMEYIAVYFKNTASGCITDYKGEFFVSDPSGADTLVVEAIGYEKQFIRILRESETGLRILLEPASLELDGAVVKPGRERYRKKDNPAIALIRNVIARKDSNRVENMDFYSCSLYEKLTLSLDDFSPDSGKRRNADYIREYIDTSEVTGKPILTVSIRETMGEFYYRKSPEERKTVRKARRHSGLDRDFDYHGNLGASLELLFTGADIFDNEVSFMMNRFVSPISSTLATSYYKYYIMGTAEVGGVMCTDLAFVPYNSQSYGFTGRLYITDDGNYAIKKVQLNFPSNSNVNWIDKLRIDQEFCQTEDGLWALEREDSYVNFTVLEGAQGVFAHQTRYFDGYDTDSSRLAGNPVYRMDGPAETLPGAGSYDEGYWDENRLLPLSRRESDIARVSDEIASKSSAVKWMRVIDALVSEWVQTTGSRSTSKFDFGPVLSTFGYNYIEGPRFRIGGMTTANLSDRWFGRGYIAYGVCDRKLKGGLTLTHSFVPRHYHPNERPVNNLSVSYSYDIYSPEVTGEQHDIVTSLKAGTVRKLQYIRRGNVRYEKQWLNSLRTDLWIENARYVPATLPGPRGVGTLRYEMVSGSGEVIRVPSVASTEFGALLRWAPGEKEFNSVSQLANIDKDTPVFTLKHVVGIRGMGGDYYYNRTEFSSSWRMHLSVAGFADARLSAGKIWNPVPWPLLIMPAANQSFSYRRETFHMMNALEFVTDQYVQLNLTWHLKGMIFNRIPLVKKLKLRELVVFNGIYGGLTEKNNPVRTPGLFILPDGTVPLGKMPYMEVGAGIENILQVFRVVYFYRLTYRDHDLGWLGKWGGLRFGVYVDF